MKLRRLSPLAALATLLLTAQPADAVIQVKLTMAKIFETAKPVVLGTVTKVNAESKIVEVKTTETIKGDPFPETFRIQVTDPPTLLKDVAEGKPVLIFGSNAPGRVAIHLGDTWLLGQVVPNTNPPAWRAAMMKDDRPQSFPGRTEALVKVVNELKAGKSTLLNAVDNQRLMGAVKEMGKVFVGKPAFLAAADVNGDGKPDLLVGGSDGVKLLLNTGSAFEDATAKWLPAGATGARAAFADVNKDGKIDLLLGKTLYLNDGQKFTPAGVTLDVPEGSPIVAEALLDVNGDAKPDAAVLLADGQLLTFANLGLPGQPWAKSDPRKLAGPVQSAVFGDLGDDGKPAVIVVSDTGINRYALDPAVASPAGFDRLTGEKIESQNLAKEGIKSAIVGLLDLNGDKRADVIITAEGGSLVLVNRGFGAFLNDPDPARRLSGQGENALPFKLTAATPWATADLTSDGTDDLIVFGADGKILVVDNPPLMPAK